MSLDPHSQPLPQASKASHVPICPAHFQPQAPPTALAPSRASGSTHTIRGLRIGSAAPGSTHPALGSAHSPAFFHRPGAGALTSPSTFSFLSGSPQSCSLLLISTLQPLRLPLSSEALPPSPTHLQHLPAPLGSSTPLPNHLGPLSDPSWPSWSSPPSLPLPAVLSSLNGGPLSYNLHTALLHTHLSRISWASSCRQRAVRDRCISSPSLRVFCKPCRPWARAPYSSCRLCSVPHFWPSFSPWRLVGLNTSAERVGYSCLYFCVWVYVYLYVHVCAQVCAQVRRHVDVCGRREVQGHTGCS